MRIAERVGLMLVGGLFVLAIGSHRPTEAQFGGMAGGGFGAAPQAEETAPPAPRVHVAVPFTEEAAAVHRALERRIPMPFQNDTPLSDVLAYIQQATSEGEGAIEGGLRIYVDERSLQEAEQSLQSPVKINLDGLPLRTTLGLVLDQLDLAYEVKPEGYLFITYAGSPERAVDPMLLILDELRALREEVAALKRAHPPGMMGGMGGGSR